MLQLTLLDLDIDIHKDHVQYIMLFNTVNLYKLIENIARIIRERRKCNNAYSWG